MNQGLIREVVDNNSFKSILAHNINMNHQLIEEGKSFQRLGQLFMTLAGFILVVVTLEMAVFGYLSTTFMQALEYVKEGSLSYAEIEGVSESMKSIPEYMNMAFAIFALSGMVAFICWWWGHQLIAKGK